MHLNAEFSLPATVIFDDQAWVASPLPGVDRIMLDRIGDEVARATSIVRYAPGSHFSPHTHDLGEEFLVLDGVFSDETGDFPAGTYVRNPPGSAHTPRSEGGCTILVKLRQFDPADAKRVVVNTAHAPWENGVSPFTRLLPLHSFGAESVFLLDVEAEQRIPVNALLGGQELFVLHGDMTVGGRSLGPWSWHRLPAGASDTLWSGPQGVRLWVKTGHMAALARAAE